LQREHLGPAIGDELAKEYGEARAAYLALKQNFESLGDYEAASWSYIKERKMEKACSAPWRVRRGSRGGKSDDTAETRRPGERWRMWRSLAKHTLKWLSDWVVEVVCNYGEGPWRTVATMLLVFGFFTGIYWITGAAGTVEQTPDGPQFSAARNLGDLAVFSLGAFAAIDPGQLEPRAAWVHILMGVEALLGIGLTGLLGFVLGNRIRRG